MNLRRAHGGAMSTPTLPTLPTLIPTQSAVTPRRRDRARVVLAAALAVTVLAGGCLAGLLVTTRGNLDAQRRVGRNLTAQLTDTRATLAATRTDLAGTRQDLAAARKDLADTTDQLTQSRSDATGAHARAERLATLAKTERMCLAHSTAAAMAAETGDYAGALALLDPATVAACQSANNEVAALADAAAV